VTGTFIARTASYFDVYIARGQQVQHIRIPRCHHIYLSIYTTVAQKLVSGLLRNRCSVFVAKKWQLASLRRLLQSLVSQVLFKGPKNGNHWARDRDCREGGASK
jgi:hypothetical protein